MGQLEVKNPRQHLAADLRERIKSAELEEGLNVIATDEDRVTLSARVKGGKIVGYVFTDAQGKRVPGILKRGSRPARPSAEFAAEATAASKDLAVADECFICRRSGKMINCVQIPCV